MKTLIQLIIVPLSLILLQGNCKQTIEYPSPVYGPASPGEQRFKHDLYSNYAECRYRNPNPEISCSETVSLYANGQADILLGGGDIIVRSSYTQINNVIRINATGGLPKEILFKIVNYTELMRNDDGTKWIRY